MDIHSPSVPRSDASTNPPNEQSAVTTSGSRQDLMQLISQKDALEEELKALGDVLKSQGVTMETPLTTFDGFPRSDIDVPQIRTTRARIIYLRNDWKALMARIETSLHNLHSLESDAKQVDYSISDHPAIEAENTVLAPFARVNSVVDQSPAAQAGLRPGDVIKRFGAVNAINHNKLSLLAETVKANTGKPLVVIISRSQAEGDECLTLVPRQGWGGRGLLGCHILPL